MQLGSDDYQFEDSYFAVVHPVTYIVIGIFVLVSVAAIIAFKKRKK
ncbi:LPXTG cell wall anchor domain-containing protein [Bacillus infantis]|nr:LPXTG cell wall anchor domain-containing protein [Bacillus infantis]RYI27610.1 LPXTG cell wall anchor domain-containing protein [Bacillus infantis]